MKNTYLFYLLFFLSALSNCTAGKANTYNLRQFSSQNGLSNSAILSLCQDNNGVLWIGSCDGLNIFDGTTPRLYKPTNTGINFSGNIIGNIKEAEENVLWIQTNYGIDRFDTRRQKIQSFKEFKDINKMAISRDNDIYLMNDDGYIYAFHQGDSAFRKLDTEKFLFDDLLQITVDGSDVLWVFSADGKNKSYQLGKGSKETTLTERDYFHHPEKLLWASSENDLLYFIDSTNAFYEYDLNSKNKYFIADLETEIKKRGEISSVIKKQNDYYIGFKSSGMIRLKYRPDQKIKYATESTDIACGIFCLVKDKYQDIIWVGTDGQGVYMFFSNTFSIKNTLLNTPAYQINNPVRALFLDHEQTLWIGTKGNGILRMPDYNLHEEGEPATERLVTSNSPLTDNSVYCFTPSRRRGLWIGTESGLNYYSYPEKRLKQFPVVADGKTVKYVHSICEQNDSTLWIATVGEGIVKISLDNTPASTPKVRSTGRIVLDEGKRASNYFFVSYRENDSILWFGNRGYGAYRMNTETGNMKPYRFDQAVQSQTVNDIFAILKNDSGYWFGTSSGLTRMNSDDYHVYNEADGFPNNTIHGILEDGKQNLWLSTNQGLVRFNTQTNTIQAFHQQNDLKVTEFSDGAYFKDDRSGTLFFGGTNGFIRISENDLNATEYMPPLQFNRLFLFGKEYNIHEFLHEDRENGNSLQLDYSQNFFGLSFIAIDFLNGNNYTYYYKVDGLSDHWIENGTSTTAMFSNLSPGQYTLLVKYRSNITGMESTPQSLIIRIVPPWYMTSWAYGGYFALFAGFVAWCVYLFVKRNRRKRDAMIEMMNRRQRNELYESKLRFFTNVTHEFCTPLTLIYGPCQRILAYPGTDGFIRKYTSMIQQNAQKLNALILELIEFRRLETGNKTLEVRRLDIAEQTRNIAESFNELAESRNIDYRLEIKEGETWNSDAGCFNKIVNNLLSNAFKYTPENGNIVIAQHIEGNQLHIRISNTGKGIKEEDLSKIFDRYKILDHFEVQNKHGISPRNGLGLAICHSMVNLLNGHIQVTSVPGERTTFEVTLPVLAATATETEEQLPPMETMMPEISSPVETENPPTVYDASKQTIVIIDDDPSMLWFVSDIFATKYNVFSYSDADKAMEQLKLKSADLIISDIMMPGTDGISFAQKLKSDKRLNRTPLILLSALNSADDQVKGIDSGAEAYVTKPFNAEYLLKLVERLIHREKELKEYYNSVFNTFTLDDGQFMHKEDKAFFEKMMQMIDQNITNPELSVELLSNSMGYSTRHFYRKLKEITEQTPADIIKNYRMAVAEHLLITTRLSIEEIMDKSGFANRGTFYKIFSMKHHMPPRQYREKQTVDSGQLTMDS